MSLSFSFCSGSYSKLLVQQNVHFRLHLALFIQEKKQLNQKTPKKQPGCAFLKNPGFSEP